MKLLILDENYPHLQNLMGDVFVHVRSKEYAKEHEVKVFSFFHNPAKLNYEGIEIEMFDRIETLVEAIKKFSPDKLLIHFYQSWMLEQVIKKMQVPVIIWVHGYEALGWYRRLFNYSWYSPVLFKYIIRNTIQQYNFRKLINYSNLTGRVKFVFVSDWMRSVTETDSFLTIKSKNIIPNPIDTDLFSYREKHPDLRKKILLLRSFSTRKYANDIAIEAILLLSKKPFFKELKITIIGKGPLFKSLTKRLDKFSNVELQERSVRQIMIPELHSDYGIFLCPTRQDAQGVSMCEAMSSGLIPITSNNTAIPEFVNDKETGFLTSNPEEVAKAIELLFQYPDIFQKMSLETATSISKICSLQNIVNQELKLINQ